MTVNNDYCADLGPATGSYRRVLWAVLVINASMFVVEMFAGVWGKSVALQANALDFLGDAATYAITLIVLGMSIRWRAGAAMIKGLTMGGFGIWVLGNTVYHMARGVAAGIRHHGRHRGVGVAGQRDLDGVAIPVSSG